MSNSHRRPDAKQGSHRPQIPPRCCHLESYFKRPKCSPMRPLAYNLYYCAQFTAKPKAACALRFSWAATSSSLSLCAHMTSSIKPEVLYITYHYAARGGPSHGHHVHKIGEDRTCSFEDMIADRQTRRERQTDALITILRSLHYRGRSKSCF